MQSYKDNYSLFDENSNFEVSITSVLGDRDEQQDSASMKIRSEEGLVIICDGMGGHNGGRLASTLATESVLKYYDDNYPSDKMTDIILSGIKNADSKIASLSDENGALLKAGSTIVCIYIKHKSLYWFSVGDSRIYIFRDGEFVRVTSDHTYKSLLNKQLESNAISKEEYSEKICQGDALISFLGVNGLPKIDINESAFDLKPNDRIIMMSDGLYKLLDDETICRIIDNFNNIKEAQQALELKAQNAAKDKRIKRDNMTVAIVHIK